MSDPKAPGQRLYEALSAAHMLPYRAPVFSKALPVTQEGYARAESALFASRDAEGAGDESAWIEREFTGHGAAVRQGGDPPIPGESFMSMDAAKEITRRALRWCSPADQIGAAEREVGRYVYRRIEALMGSKPGTADGAELTYLARVAEAVEEYGEDACAGGSLADCPFISPSDDLERWIEGSFAGMGVAVRFESDPAVPGEPFMSMATAKELARRAVAVFAAWNRRTPSPEVVEALERQIIDAIALLDVAIAGTVFTKPNAGRIIVNVAKAQAVLDGLRQALASLRSPGEANTGEL